MAIFSEQRFIFESNASKRQGPGSRFGVQKKLRKKLKLSFNLHWSSALGGESNCAVKLKFQKLILNQDYDISSCRDPFWWVLSR